MFSHKEPDKPLQWGGGPSRTLIRSASNAWVGTWEGGATASRLPVGHLRHRHLGAEASRRHVGGPLQRLGSHQRGRGAGGQGRLSQELGEARARATPGGVFLRTSLLRTCENLASTSFGEYRRSYAEDTWGYWAGAEHKKSWSPYPRESKEPGPMRVTNHRPATVQGQRRLPASCPRRHICPTLPRSCHFRCG
jgi:hypothetical protein